MITAYLPNATPAQVTTFLTNRTVTSAFYAATFHATGATFPTGVIVEFDEPENNWAAVKAILVAACASLSLARIRVMFTDIDIGKPGGRLAAASFWVNSDGTQSEV